jgi:nucleoside 2-deoxyribosyltransferase
MKAYVSVAFDKRKELNEVINSISSVLLSLKIEPFVFVDKFHFSPAQEKEMMSQAMKSIDECNLLIAETSGKAIGVGVEAGYAKAAGKPLIYVRNKTAEHSTTISGISDYLVIYNDCKDLEEKLTHILIRVFKQLGF